jgi:RecB family exonuclease
LSFFLADVLDARPLDELVLSSEMDALNRGNLIHKVLENFLIRAIDDGATPPVEYLHELLRDESSKLKQSFGTFWVQVFFDRALEDIAAELDGWFEEHSLRVERGWTARETEKRFGDDANKGGIVDSAVSVTLDHGQQISFKGQVDRIDLSSLGQVQVVDYKTGSKTSLEKLESNPPSLGRTKFQLGVYGLFARNLEMARSSDKTALASYWFTKHSSDVDSEGDPECYVTISLDEAFVKTFEEDVREVVSLIQEGLFPPKAPEFGFDRYTALQGQETVSDLWSGMQDSPLLARFREVFGLGEEESQ